MFTPFTIDAVIQDGVLVIDASAELDDPTGTDITNAFLTRLDVVDACGNTTMVYDFRLTFTYMPLGHDAFYCGS